MLEKTIVAKIKKALEAEGAKCIKTHGNPYLEAGTPDILGVYKGRCFAIEVKKDEKEGPTMLQIKRLNEWYKSGARAGVAWGVARSYDIMVGYYDDLTSPKI